MNRSLSMSLAALAFALPALHAQAEPAKPAKPASVGKEMEMCKPGAKISCSKCKSGAEEMSCMQNMSSAVVEAVDQAGKTITLKHGPIKSKTIEMGAMTMPFAAKDTTILENVRPGDKILFIAENVDNVATVTELTIQK